MENKEYVIKYSPTFIKQLNEILEYFVTKLQNKIAADNFLDEVIKAIEDRSKSPQSYEKYISSRERKNQYYRIYVKNHIIFYVVKSNVIEVRRILYSKRNYRKLL